MRRLAGFSLSFFFLFTLNLYAWTPGLMEAAKAVADGTATKAQKVMVHVNRAEVSRMALKNRQFQKDVFPKVEKAFNETNREDIQRIAEKFGMQADAKVSQKGPNPGSDTDVAVRPINPSEELTLEKIRAMDDYHEEMLRARCRENGVPFKKSDIDTDFLPDPDFTTDSEFRKIADYINHVKGGTAYESRMAAKAEIKLGQGKKLTPAEVAAYNSEMKLQQKRKVLKNKKNFQDLAKAKKAGNLSAVQDIEARIQLNQSQQGKYTQRVRRMNDTLRKEYGMDPLRRNITGADGAMDMIDLAGRNAGTAMDASTVGALSDSAMRRAQEELADTLIDAGKHFPSARQSLPAVLNDLPPSAQGNMIARMEKTLGTEATTDIVKKARILKKGTSKAAREIAGKMKSDLNFGKKPEFAGGVTKLQVVMTAMNAVMMAKTGYEITLQNIKPTDSDFDMFSKMVANSLYYGSGIGGNFDKSMAEEMDRFQKAYLRGEGPSMTGHITATFLKTGLRLGKDAIFGIMEIPDGIAHLLAWGRDWASGAGALKEYAYAKNALADAMRKVILEKKAFQEAMKMVDEYGVKPEDTRAFLNCLCRDCGGSLGGSYNPGWEGGGYGPCVCSGPLSMWKTPVKTSKETALSCFNAITKNRYMQDQAVFDQWRKKAVQANAESVRPAVQEVRSMIRTMDANWQEDAVAAAKIFNAIQPLMLDADKRQIQKVLTPRLINAANHNVVDEGDIKKGIKRLELAQKTGGKEDLIERRLADYKKWEERWADVVQKQVPEIKSLIRKGSLEQAKSRMERVQFRMSAQGGNYYPPTNDPRWLALTDLYNQKAEQMRQERTEAMKQKAEQMRQERTEARKAGRKPQSASGSASAGKAVSGKAASGKAASGKAAAAGSSQAPSAAVPARPVKGKVYELNASAYTHGVNKKMTIRFSGLDPAKKPWIGIYKKGAANNQYLTYQYAPKGAGSGELTFKLPTAPGQYNIRVFYEGYKHLETSPDFTIHRGVYTVTPEKTVFTITRDKQIKVAYECAQPAKGDWVGIYKAGAGDRQYVSFKYTPVTQTGEVSIDMPKDPGEYELRLFHTGYKRLAAAKQQITVKPGNASVQPDKASYAKGEFILARFERPLDRKGDWIGIYEPDAPDRKYMGYVYTKEPYSGSLKIAAPNKPGRYELRLYHSGYKFIVKSRTFTVN